MHGGTSSKPPDSPRASTTGKVVATSPWSFDLGGAQRTELASRNEALAEDLRLQTSQLVALRQLQKGTAGDARIERWIARTTAPTFSAWRRAVVTWRAERLIEAERRANAAATAEAARAIQDKESQLGALADRVARVKANAQAKLTELSSANTQLAAALERKDQELLDAQARAKHLTRASGAQGEREVELQLEATRLAEAVTKAEHAAARSARALVGYQRDAVDLRARSAADAASLTAEREAGRAQEVR